MLLIISQSEGGEGGALLYFEFAKCITGCPLYLDNFKIAGTSLSFQNCK